MDANSIARQAKKTGTVWLGGEMEFPANEGPKVAFAKALRVAEACGYLVKRNGLSAFSVTGGEIPGYVVVDWFRTDAEKLVKVEMWTCNSAYLDEQGET